MDPKQEFESFCLLLDWFYIWEKDLAMHNLIPFLYDTIVAWNVLWARNCEMLLLLCGHVIDPNVIVSVTET